MVDRVGAVTAATDQLARATGGPTSADGVEEGESSTPASNIDASTRGVERGGAVAAADGRFGQHAGAAAAPACARVDERSKSLADVDGSASKRQRVAGSNASTRAETTQAPAAAAADGRVLIRYHNGDYEGELQDGKPHGHGVRQWLGGASYDGEWEQGKRHGKGR